MLKSKRVLFMVTIVCITVVLLALLLGAYVGSKPNLAGTTYYDEELQIWVAVSADPNFTPYYDEAVDMYVIYEWTEIENDATVHGKIHTSLLPENFAKEMKSQN